MRVFFDASVIIAALLSPHGGSSLLFHAIKAGLITGITSQTVLEEVLEEDKPAKLKKSYKEIAEFIAQSRLVVREHITPEEVAPYTAHIDREDAHLIAGAKLTKCTHLVSLDRKHVVKPNVKKKFSPLRIVTPKELLEEIVRKK